MVLVLFVSSKIQDSPVTKKINLDIISVFLSAFGMILLVYGMLQSRYWGWIKPLKVPIIGGTPIAPLGISIVTYLILFGLLILVLFYSRQVRLEAEGKQALLKASILKLPVLRSGLMLLAVQYFTIASIFFIIPVYLQTILGFNALETGLKLIPLSIGLLIFTLIGSKITGKYPTRKIIRVGQLIMATGGLFILSSIDLQLQSKPFWFGLFLIGVGFGLFASQLGNTIMSSVDKSDSSEAGGLQGTFQNLGLTYGTALVGSIFLLTLTSGFTNAIDNSNLNNNTKLFLIEDFDKVLSLDLLKEEKTMIDESLVKEIEKLIDERNTAKANKNYTRADEIRDYLLSKGIIIKDSREGTTYEIKEIK
jgi:hypothetical protein